MTTLDLGGVAGRVILDDSQFQRVYAKVVGQMRSFGGEAAKAAGGVNDLDAAMTRAGKAGSTAAEGSTRAARAATMQAKAAASAAKASTASAGAQDRVSAAMAKVAGQDVRVQQATLRLIAAQERLTGLEADENATTKQLASAKAGLIGAQRSLTRAQQLAAGTARGLIETEDAQTAAIERLETAMAGLTGASDKQRAAALRQEAAQEKAAVAAGRGSAQYAKLASAEAAAASASATVAATSKSTTRELAATAKSLGLMFGAFELVHQAIDIGKDASEFQANMRMIATMAGAPLSEVKKLNSALLDMAGQVGVGPTELAKAMYHVEQNSHGLLSVAKMLDIVRKGAEGARIGLADVEDTTNMLTIASASGIKGVQNMSKAMGTMLAIAGTGDMRLKDLNEAMSTGVLSIAKQYGASLNDVAAVLATLGDNGIRGVNAAQGLRQTLMGMASPAARGADSLAKVGLQMDTLSKDMTKHGLVHAMNLLKDKMDAAGVTGGKVGAFITDVFGRRAGKSIAVLFGEIDRVNAKAKEGAKGAESFAERWEQTQHTASQAFHRLGASFEAEAIRIAQKSLPTVSKVADVVAVAIPKAVGLAKSALAPFATAWHGVSAAARAAAPYLKDVINFLKPAAPYIEGVAGAVLSMWAAFKGYRAARAVVLGLSGVMRRMSASVTGSLRSVGMQYGLVADKSAAALAVQKADALQSQAIADRKAAAIQTAAAEEAEAQAMVARAFQTASEEEIASMEATALAARSTAVKMEASAAASAASAETAAGEIAIAGRTARLGFASALGPLGLAAIGVMTLVTMFHKSKTASHEAADAAKAYTDALKGGGGTAGGDVFGAIVKQLSDNHVPEKIGDLNKALGSTKLSGATFAKAIQSGGKPLSNLRDHLHAVIDAQQAMIVKQEQLSHSGGSRAYLFDAKKYNAAKTALKSAKSLLADLDAQYGALTKAQRKEIANLKSFGQASVAIQNVAQTTHLASKTAQDYAGMLGFVADKNGVVVGSAKKVEAAVQTVSDAYDNATQSGDEFLSALKSFSGSAGTAADRAALIGATLKAANGDALGYASTMNGAASANAGLVTSLAQAAKQTGKNGISVHTLMGRIVKLKKGTIDYTKAAAAPLISGLQSMQDAAMQAAQAQYQHSKATLGGKKAADEAYKTYVANTRGALIDEAKKLGITKGQAKKLADQYFGMPKKVKTLIEQEGANPIVTVLNKIGTQLSYLTGHKWNVGVHAHVSGLEQINRARKTVKYLSNFSNAQIYAAFPHAAGAVVNARTAVRKHAAGAVVNRPTWITPVDIAGEAGREAIVPLDRPLAQIDKSVRGLAAVAQGKAGAFSDNRPAVVQNFYPQASMDANAVGAASMRWYQAGVR